MYSVYTDPSQLDRDEERAPLHVQAERDHASVNLRLEEVKSLQFLLVRQEILGGLFKPADAYRGFNHFQGLSCDR